MRCTLLIPHLFWPRETADTVTHGLEARGLAKLLARARCDRYPAVTLEAWLCQAFGVERQHDWPIAPLTLALDGVDPGESYWLRADPVHIRIGSDRLLLGDNALFDLARDEATALIATLNHHFSDHGITFHAPRAKRWYARPAQAPQLVTHPISEAKGRDVRHHLPAGADALEWHRIFNEVQMLLHEHDVNEAREARAQAAVNSVWFWGGGRRCAVPGRDFDAVWSDNDVATALATAADIQTGAAPADAATWLRRVAAADPRADSHLVVLEDLAAPVAYEDSAGWRDRLEHLEAHWFAPLVRAVHEGRVGEAALVALGREHCCRFAMSRRNLMKIWRRAKPLSAYA